VDPLLERVRQILTKMAMQPHISFKADLVPLFRQILLRRGGENWVRVPAVAPWPSKTEWRTASFRVLEKDQGFQIQAEYPRLHWLGTQADLFDDAVVGLRSKANYPEPGDPFLAKSIGLPSYTGTGQREAVRALLQAPTNLTLIANLPTGAGKSLLAQLPPILTDDGRLTLAIVPTVALAIDQAERMAALFRHHDPDWNGPALAYHGGTSGEARLAIIQAIRRGGQRILFTSPECATGSLRLPLEEAANHGLISHLFIDEAHLVIGWGNGFRPAFQLLPALARRIRELVPPETLRVTLASATLTQATTQALRQLFSQSGRPLLVSAVHLRPEPRYAMFHCASEEIRSQRVREAIRCAPRPFILYVTRPVEAIEWVAELKAEGYRRVDAFHGKTPPGDRERIIQAWQGNQLDGIVATSAFGLGMDKNDVRSIVHATLPESVDRFYQEVGRSGRDGLASASLLLFTNNDVRQAEGMASDTLIGDDNGYTRWSLMINKAISDAETPDLHWVDLGLVPPHLNVESAENCRWNIRTLNLMARAGLIELVALRQGDRQILDSDSMDLGERDLFAAIRILEPGHHLPQFFSQHMASARSEMHRATDEGFQRMRTVAYGKQEISEALCATYSFIQAEGWAPVTSCCGGCSQHWENRTTSQGFSPPYVPRLERFKALPFPERLLANLPMVAPNILVVAVSTDRPYGESLKKLFDALSGTMRFHTMALERHCGEQIRRLVAEYLRDETDSPVFLDSFDSAIAGDRTGGHQEVRILVWGPDSPPIPTGVWLTKCKLQVMVVPSSIRDAQQPGRHLIDTYAHVHIDDFLDRLTL
jgi:superfamily II DNA/RNA helicase